MVDFDIVVIGGGTGNKVARAAAESGQTVALIERGPIGGTCVNRGCNPSKTLIQHAKIAETIRRADEFAISARIEEIDFTGIIQEVVVSVDEKAAEMERADEVHENITLYREEARFVGKRTLDVGGDEVRGSKVVIAAGTRPFIPPIENIDTVPYLTSREALRLETQPKHLVIIGGGYIAAELGHFYEALGTRVTIIGSEALLLSREDGDVAETFTEIARQRHTIYTGYTATAVEYQQGSSRDEIKIHAENQSGEAVSITGDALLLTTGRRPNTDTLDLETAGISLTDRGFVETNEFLETSAENVWASGDIAGNYQLKHAADHEAKYVIANAVHGEHQSVTYPGMAHAVFTAPQIASTGATEEQLQDTGREYVIGRCAFADTVMGGALKDHDGFVKVLAAPDSGRVLGCHIIGHEASTLIHEVSVAVTRGTGTVEDITDVIHVHPSLNKVVLEAFEDVEVDR